MRQLDFDIGHTSYGENNANHLRESMHGIASTLKNINATQAEPLSESVKETLLDNEEEKKEGTRSRRTLSLQDSGNNQTLQERSLAYK